MIKQLLHRVLLSLAPICFNVLNLLLLGNLTPLSGACVIVEDDGRFLLVFHTDGLVSFPGGLMRWREHPRQTAVRECEEETGLKVELHPTTLGACSQSSASLFRLSTIKVVYVGTVIGGALRGSVEGYPRWVSEDEVKSALDRYCPNILEDYYAYRDRANRV